MWKSAERLPVSPDQVRMLQTRVRAHTTPQSIVTRSKIILMASTGASNSRIAKELGVSRPTVLLWRQRFLTGGVAALSEVQAGRGRRASISAEKVKAIIDATLHTRPKGATHWSCRTMANAQGVSPATVQRIWDAHRLQPHRVKTFKDYILDTDA